MLNDTELLEIEREIDALLGEAEREFTNRIPIVESLDRLFVRISPQAIRVLAVRGMVATWEHRNKQHVCAECGTEIEG